MSFKILADTFSVSRDSDHFIQLKTIKKPRCNDEIWIAFEVVGSTKFARSIVQSFVEAIEDVFFNNTDLDSYERFELTLKEINLIYKNIKQKRGDKALGKINGLIASYSGNDLYLSQSNDAEAYLIRKSKLSPISEGLSGKSNDLFVNIASGELMPEDKVIFSTSRLLRLATHNQIAQICTDGVTEAIDSMRELILSNNELSIGIIAMHIKLPHRTSARSIKMTNPLMEKFKQYVLQQWDSAINFIESKMGGKKFHQMDKNTILAGILLIILLLIISVSFLMDGRRDTALRDEYRLQIEAMNQDLYTANTKGYANDKETANAIIEKVESEARAILETNFFRAEALALLDKIQETKDSINNTTRVSNATPYADLSSKQAEVEAIGLVNLDDNFYAYEYNELYEVILDQVLDPKTIDETEVIMSASSMEDFGIIAFLTQSGRIIEYNDGQFVFANTNDDNWKSGIDIAAYGKYLYVLSPKNNQIYKYAKLRSKYSSSTEYNLDANLENAISFAIDGNIYVLKKGGEIIKIFKSKKQQFEIEDLAVDISEASKLYTTPELNELYILDPVNRRVVVVTKDVGLGARYKEQIFFEDLEDIQDIYVNQSEDKLYLLTKKEIYQVDI